MTTGAIGDKCSIEMLRGWVSEIGGTLYVTNDSLLTFFPRGVKPPPALLECLEVQAEEVVRCIRREIAQRKPEPARVEPDVMFDPLEPFEFTFPKGDDNAEAIVRGALPEEGTEDFQAPTIHAAETSFGVSEAARAEEVNSVAGR